ncbi:dihydroxyacetone kinase phosphoryl donor subunit DhaM [soil metagenome]
MIGLVLVSHSAKLAEGLAELVAQMEPEVPLAWAGGTDDGELGTSLELVLAAIDDADQGDGAVVLFDLGSAEMTAESALEFLDDDQRDRLRVVDAPLVEGAIAAAGIAGGDATLDDVVAAAQGAVTATAAHDGDGHEPDGEDVELDQSIELELTNRSGLHARPAGQISRAMRPLDATVRIERADTGDSGDSVNASSTLRLVSLGAPAGTRIVVRAGGPDASAAIAAIQDLVERNFDEPPDDDTAD